MGAWFPGFSGFSSQSLIVCRCSENVTFEAALFLGVSSVENRKRNCTSHQGVPRNGPLELLAWTQRTLGKIPDALESARTPLGTRQPSRLNFPFSFALFCCCCCCFLWVTQAAILWGGLQKISIPGTLKFLGDYKGRKKPITAKHSATLLDLQDVAHSMACSKSSDSGE